jgi:hypothetical protein
MTSKGLISKINVWSSTNNRFFYFLLKPKKNDPDFLLGGGEVRREDLKFHRAC